MGTDRKILLSTVATNILLFVVFVCFSLPRLYHQFVPEKPVPEFSERYNSAIQYHSRMDATIPEGTAIFIGDSHIAGLCTDAVISPSVNYGIGGDTTLGVLRRLPLYSSLKKASTIVYAIGCNDLDRRSNEEIVGNIRRIIGATPGGSKVVLNAILPINGDPIASKRIAEINVRLKTIAAEHGWIYVDPGKRLSDLNGYLLPEFDDGDGTHLNAAGYRIWIKELRNAIGS